MFTRKNTTGIATPHDRVDTPLWVGWLMSYHFRPAGRILEPCRGKGNIYRYLPQPDTDWCEIDEGRDYLKHRGHYDWLFVNPPYSIFNGFMAKVFEDGDNVPVVMPLAKQYRSKTYMDLTDGFGVPEILILARNGTNLGFPFGYPVGVVYYKRGYRGTTEKIDYS
jgi:hypothetical protein